MICRKLAVAWTPDHHRHGVWREAADRCASTGDALQGSCTSCDLVMSCNALFEPCSPEYPLSHHLNLHFNGLLCLAAVNTLAGAEHTGGGTLSAARHLEN